MADKKGKLGPLLFQGGTQVAGFVGTATGSEAASAAVEGFINKDKPAAEQKPLHPAAKAAITSVVTAGAGATALAFKGSRKYAPAVIGGGLLKLVVDVAPPLGNWIRKKVAAMFAKKAAGTGRGTQGIGPQRSQEIRSDSRIRDLVN